MTNALPVMDGGSARTGWNTVHNAWARRGKLGDRCVPSSPWPSPGGSRRPFVHSSDLSDPRGTLGRRLVVPNVHRTYDDWLFGSYTSTSSEGGGS